MERLEQREQALNKRQSAIDRRLNDVEKAYSQQMAELQRIAQMIAGRSAHGRAG